MSWSGIAALLMLLLLPVSAAADGISGSLEYNYGTFDSELTDSNGTSKSRSDNFNQRYILMLENTVTTTIRLSAGANIQTSRSWGDTDGEEFTSTTTRIAPYASLTYGNGIYTGGGGFYRNMVSSKQNGVSAPTRFNDTSNAFFSWKPDEFPSLNLLFSNLDSYDEDRETTDINNKSFNLSSSYKPLKTLDLNYSALYSIATNHLLGYETTSLNQSLMARYSDIFLNNRISLSSGYSISLQESTITNKGAPSGGSGVLTSLVSPLPDGGLFAISTLPDTPAQGELATRPQVVNGNANILITLTAPAASPDPLNFGMHFNGAVNPALEVSLIRVLLSSNLNDLSGKEQLLQSAFNWDLYVSSNNLDWTQVAVTSQSFSLTDPVTGNTSPGFDIRFNAVSGVQYIKVVTRPAFLADATTPPLTSVTVTKLEAFTSSIPTPVGTSKSASQTGGVFDLYMKARLMNLPLLTYDLGFNLTHSKSDTSAFAYRYNVINGLSLLHQFNQVFSGSARASREDSVNPDSTSSATGFSASLSAVPLPTLSHMINFSARQNRDRTSTRTSYSLSNSNSAELYRGVSTSLALSGSLSSDDKGKEQKSATGALGVNLVPHRTMNVNMSFSLSSSSSSGGDEPDATTTTRSSDVSVTYAPLPSLYLFFSSSISQETGQGTRTATSFGGGWSPFREGTMQFNTSYREDLQGDTKNRSFAQTVRWNIRQGASFDVAYIYADANSTASDTTSKGVTGTLRVRF